MRAPGALAIAAVLAVGAFYAHSVLETGPVPTQEELEVLAEEEWERSSCLGLGNWPCAGVTSVELDRSSMNWAARDRGQAYRPCYYLHLELENTPWDPAVGGPATPRTYVKLPDPIRRCAEVSAYMPGQDSEGETWTFLPDANIFAELDALLKEVYATLCPNGPPSCVN